MMIKGRLSHLSFVYPLLILILFLTACQNLDSSPAAAPGKEPNVQQAGTALITDESEEQHAQHTLDGGTHQESIKPPAAAEFPGFRLLGFALQEPMSAVIAQYGHADEQFTMEDGEEVIIVHYYPGFTIGCNHQRGIHFIDVYSANIDPQLDGLRIGSTRMEALDILGEPMQHTLSVIMYEREGTILKLDIDHTSDQIVSIKLFAAASS